MDKANAIEIEAGSEVASEMLEFQLGDIAAITKELIDASERQIEGWEPPISKELYEEIVDKITDACSCGSDDLIAMGILVVSLGMSFIANVERLQLILDIEKIDLEIDN